MAKNAKLKASSKALSLITVLQINPNDKDKKKDKDQTKDLLIVDNSTLIKFLSVLREPKEYNKK